VFTQKLKFIHLEERYIMYTEAMNFGICFTEEQNIFYIETYFDETLSTLYLI